MFAELLEAGHVVGVPLGWHRSSDTILANPRTTTLADLLAEMLTIPDQFAF